MLQIVKCKKSNRLEANLINLRIFFHLMYLTLTITIEPNIMMLDFIFWSPKDMPISHQLGKRFSRIYHYLNLLAISTNIRAY